MNWHMFDSRYAGERLFIVGNGPSLLQLSPEEISALKQEYLFMGSRFYEWTDSPLTPSFYIVSERRQTAEWLDGRHEKVRASIAKFWVNWQPAPKGWTPIPRPPSEAHNVNTFGLFGGLEGECENGVDKGNAHLHHAKVTPLAALQVAKTMGFSEFYLLGCEATDSGEVYNPSRERKMHAPGIEREVFALAKDILVDCTPRGLLAKERGGSLEYRKLEDVLGL